MNAPLATTAVRDAFLQVTERARDRVIGDGGIFVEDFDFNGRAHFVGLTSRDTWALVLSTEREARTVHSIRLASINVDFSISHRLERAGQSEHRRVSIVECRSGDPVIRELFATFCAAILNALPPKPNDSALEREVNRWVSLFWRIQGPARTDVVGLIGELMILDQVSDKDLWVRAWHLDASDNLDYSFSSPPMSLEVKSTTGQQRVHEISLSQSNPPVPQEHYFASLIVELRESGITIRDLVYSIRNRLRDAESERIFWSALSSVCGSSLPEFFEVRFSLPVSRSSLQIYNALDVPVPIILTPMPAGVSRVRFRSDFSSAEPVKNRHVLAYRPAPNVRF